MKKLLVLFIILVITGCGGDKSSKSVPVNESMKTDVENFMRSVVQRVNSVKRQGKFEATVQSALHPQLPYQEKAVVLARLKKIWGARTVKVTKIEKNSYGQIQAKVRFSKKRSKEIEMTFNLLVYEGKLVIAGVL